MLRKTILVALVATALAGCGEKDKKKDKDAPAGDAGGGSGDQPPPASEPLPDQGGGGGGDPQKTYVLEPGQGVASSRGAFLAHLTWPDGLASETELRARLTFAKVDRTKPASVTLTKFDPQMPSMGHGTDVEDQKFVAEETHVVRVDGVWINMGGDWVIRVHATVDGEADLVEIPLDDVP